MYSRSTTIIFWLLLLSTLFKIDMSAIDIYKPQLSHLENSAQFPTLLARVVHDSDDRSPPKEEKN
jgi:hypothetical protein